MKKQKKKNGRAIPIRLNILFFCVFLLFSGIIIQLGKVQIFDGETYKNEVEKEKMQLLVLQFHAGKFLIEKVIQLLTISLYVRLHIQR